MLDFWAAYFDSDNALVSILWPIFFGIVLAILLSIGISLTIGKFCRRLLAADIDRSDKAKTFAELGFGPVFSFLLSFALRSGTTLRRLVLPVTDTVCALETELVARAEAALVWKKETYDDTVDTDDATDTDDTDDATDTTDADDTAATEDNTEHGADTAPETDALLTALYHARYEKVDCKRAKWFLNPMEKGRTDTLYNARAISPLALVLSIAALFGLALAAFFLIPVLANLLPSF